MESCQIRFCARLDINVSMLSGLLELIE